MAAKIITQITWHLSDCIQVDVGRNDLNNNSSQINKIYSCTMAVKIPHFITQK